MKDRNEIEKCVVEFFRMLRVGKDQTLPKKNTYEMYRSFIKCLIIKKTSWDITNIALFPNFKPFYHGLIKAVEKNQLEKASQSQEETALSRLGISEELLHRIYKLIYNLHGLVLGNPEDESYQAMIEELPIDYKDKYHYLAQYGKI